MMRIGEMKILAGERSGLPSLLRRRCVSGWNFLDFDILGVCEGENIGMVPFDFLLGFGIFIYLPVYLT